MLWRKNRRDRSPPEPPASCCCFGAHALSVAPGDRYLVRCLSSQFTAVSFISPEQLSQLDGGHPLLTTFFDYPIYFTQLSLSFGLSTPVRASISSEANSQDRRGNTALQSLDLQLRMMPNESAFLVGLGQLEPHKADVMPNWSNKSGSIAETFSQTKQRQNNLGICAFILALSQG